MGKKQEDVLELILEYQHDVPALLKWLKDYVDTVLLVAKISRISQLKARKIVDANLNNILGLLQAVDLMADGAIRIDAGDLVDKEVSQMDEVGSQEPSKKPADDELLNNLEAICNDWNTGLAVALSDINNFIILRLRENPKFIV